MSHVVAVNIQVKDLDCLEKACKTLGLQLNRGQKTHKWYGRWVGDYHQDDAAYKNGVDPKTFGQCEHAISIPGNKAAYEIGVIPVKDKPGTYNLLWDFWNGGNGLQELVGRDTGLLKQQYAKEVAKKQLQALTYKGYMLQESVDADNGDIVLKAVKY